MATPIMTHCPGCGQPLDYYLQDLDPRSKLTPRWIGTCRTVGCGFELITLQDANWQRIATDADFATQYRGMNAKMAVRR